MLRRVIFPHRWYSNPYFINIYWEYLYYGKLDLIDVEPGVIINNLYDLNKLPASTKENDNMKKNNKIYLVTMLNKDQIDTNSYMDSLDNVSEAFTLFNKNQNDIINHPLLNSVEEHPDDCRICDICKKEFDVPENCTGMPNAINLYTDSLDSVSEGFTLDVCPDCMAGLFFFIGSKGESL